MGIADPIGTGPGALDLRIGLSIGHASEPFEASIQLAEDAERAGLDFISVGDAGADCFALLGAVAARTSRLALMSGIATWSRSPLTMAQAAKTVSNLCGGRFLLGIGPMPRTWATQWHGLAYDPVVARMREYVTTVRACLDARADRPATRRDDIPRGRLPGSPGHAGTPGADRDGGHTARDDPAGGGGSRCGAAQRHPAVGMGQRPGPRPHRRGAGPGGAPPQRRRDRPDAFLRRRTKTAGWPTTRCGARSPSTSAFPISARCSSRSASATNWTRARPHWPGGTGRAAAAAVSDRLVDSVGVAGTPGEVLAKARAVPPVRGLGHGVVQPQPPRRRGRRPGAPARRPARRGTRGGPAA